MCTCIYYIHTDIHTHLRGQRVHLVTHSSRILFWIMKNVSSGSIETDCLSYSLMYVQCQAKNIVKKSCSIDFG